LKQPATFAEAIKIDPEYAPARASMALAWLMLERKEFGAVDTAQVDAVVEPQLQMALSLSPDLPEAIAIRGLHHLQRYRYDEARQDFNRAIELSPICPGCICGGLKPSTNRTSSTCWPTRRKPTRWTRCR
jgi:tetratricopeptide (TPR) repeat protein